MRIINQFKQNKENEKDEAPIPQKNVHSKNYIRGLIFDNIKKKKKERKERERGENRN